MKSVRCLVVGTGGWARVHLDAWRECPNAEVVALCDPLSEKDAQAVGQEYGIKAFSADLDDLIDQTQPGLIDVPCNPHYRLEPVKIAAGHECVKLVNLEKPIALQPSDAYEIERIRQKNDLRITVNHQKRFLPGWRKAKEAIDEGRIGHVNFLRASCQGNILEQGTHLVDMVLNFTNYSPVSWVMGQVGELEGFDKPQASAPDSATATLAFADGGRAYLAFGSVGQDVPGETNKWMQFTCEAYGSAGVVQVSLNQTLRIAMYDGTPAIEESTSWDDHYIEALSAHLGLAADCVADPSIEHPSTLKRALMGFEVIMAIYESARATRRVNLPWCADDSVIESLKAMRNGGDV